MGQQDVCGWWPGRKSVANRHTSNPFNVGLGDQAAAIEWQTAPKSLN